MKNSNQKPAVETVFTFDNPDVASENSASNEVRDVLSQILRDGAQKMLQAAIQKEIDEYLQDRSGIVRSNNGAMSNNGAGRNNGAIQIDSRQSDSYDPTCQP